MKRPESCQTLVESFLPGVTPEDNTPGALKRDLSKAMNCIIRARFQEEPQYITDEVISTVCNTISWLETIFEELKGGKR